MKLHYEKRRWGEPTTRYISITNTIGVFALKIAHINGSVYIYHTMAIYLQMFGKIIGKWA